MMTTVHAEAAEFRAPPTWLRVILGLGLILAGVVVLADVTTATLIKTMLIAVVAIAAGAFEIVHAFWARGWGELVWQIILGALYVAFGLVMLNQPVQGALILTYVLGLLLLASGVVRMLVSFRRWRDGGWIMLISGLFGVFAGLVILSQWPISGLWVLGLLLGIDLISHGVAWLAFGRPRSAITRGAAAT
jgi:uncharacterized membrane protein HdeD (DUF308 family)